MPRFLDLLYEYLLLRAKERELQIPLDEAEQARLGGLEQLLRGEGDPHPGGKRRMPRVLCPMPVQLTKAGDFGSGQLRDVSGDGMRIVTSMPVEPGSEVLVHAVDPELGVEQVFPTRVVWRRLGARPAIAVSFCGAPWKLMPPQGAGGGRRRRRPTPMVA